MGEGGEVAAQHVGGDGLGRATVVGGERGQIGSIGPDGGRRAVGVGQVGEEIRDRVAQPQPGDGLARSTHSGLRCLIVLGSCDNSKSAGLATGAAALVTAEPQPSLLR